MALICADNGNFDQAREHLKQADPRIPAGYPVRRGSFLCHSARVEFLTGNTPVATMCLSEAQAIADDLEVHPDSELCQEIAKIKELVEFK